MPNKPLAIDLFAGLGGWSEGLLAEGYDVAGFDIERHVYGDHRYPAQLVIQDVTTLHGAQFRDAALIVASPPCQAYSWMAMPWTKAKAKAAAIRADATGQMLADLNRLFDACFRIQQEACAAAGRHIPMVVENVRGAQPWVGRSRWMYGSFALWGDVPALMPIVRPKAKVPGLNWNGFKNGDPNYRGQAFNTHAECQLREDIKNTGGSWFAVAHNTTSGKGQNPDGRKSARGGKDGWFGDYATMKDGIKQHGSGREWFAGDGRMTSSKSPARKFASAMIAKIPLPLSRHIAATFRSTEASAA